jgi:hypothetical protein
MITEISPRKVHVSPESVRLFNARWPCSKLQGNRAYWFDFDNDGNLIDCDVPEHSDGPESVAMADDCKAWLFDDETAEWME